MCVATIKANLKPRQTRAIAVVTPMMRMRCRVPVVTQATQTCRLSDAMTRAKTTKLRVLLMIEIVRSVVLARKSPDNSAYGCIRLPVR